MSDDDTAANVVFRGKRYHHVTGCMASLLHASNPEFAEAIRRERSASIAREMANPTRTLWADLDLGKRPLAPAEVERFDLVRDALLEEVRACVTRGTADRSRSPDPETQRAWNVRERRASVTRDTAGRSRSPDPERTRPAWALRGRRPPRAPVRRAPD